MGLSAAPKPAPSPAAHLAKLNAEQLYAAEYGGPDFYDTGPLLIIAGAGSGKTNTLAHRVAHLILNGIDPRRMMLLTFSRRAAAEMTRRKTSKTTHAAGSCVLLSQGTVAVYSKLRPEPPCRTTQPVH